MFLVQLKHNLLTQSLKCFNTLYVLGSTDTLKKSLESTGFQYIICSWFNCTNREYVKLFHIVSIHYMFLVQKHILISLLSPINVSIHYMFLVQLNSHYARTGIKLFQYIICSWFKQVH